jgi:hypothetical protein
MIGKFACLFSLLRALGLPFKITNEDATVIKKKSGFSLIPIICVALLPMVYGSVYNLFFVFSGMTFQKMILRMEKEGA